jgi:hypothetical protein
MSAIQTTSVIPGREDGTESPASGGDPALRAG